MHEIERGDPQYPAALLDTPSPPHSIFLLGDKTILDLAPNRLVAIVGTRDASPYGLKVATELAKAFVSVGIGVVSGLARGIDSAAHRAALDAGGKTIAVMGTGADIPYPVGHRALHAEIVAKGLVVSENKPGSRAHQGCFPRRNRIIAALARVTIVVEAPYKSGAINTATQALEANRVVGAIPGPIDSPRSAGSNLLMRDGAQILNTIGDALALYGLSRGAQDEGPVLGTLETTVWNALEAGPAGIEPLAARASLTVREALEGVARLELTGLVMQLPTGEIARVRIA